MVVLSLRSVQSASGLVLLGPARFCRLDQESNRQGFAPEELIGSGFCYSDTQERATLALQQTNEPRLGALHPNANSITRHAMKPKFPFTRRRFIRTTAAGSFALGWLGAKRSPSCFASEAPKPAILGGTPVHPGG